MVALAQLGGIGQQIAAAIREIILTIVEILTPIVDILGIGMIIFGLLLVGLRQEFYGLRLIIGGGIALAMIHLVIPMLLGFI